MITSTLLLIVSLFVFVFYLVLIWFKFGIQKSISDSYYRLKGHDVLFFTLFIWGSTLPIIIAANSPLMFLAGGLICFVGSAPAFKKTKLEGLVHIIGASGGYALGFLSIIHEFGFWWLALPAAVLAAFFKKNSPYYIWFAEIIGFFTIWLAVLLNIVL